MGEPITDWRPLFRCVMNQLDRDLALRKPGPPAIIKIQIANRIRVNGVEALKVELAAKIRRVLRKLELASLVAYADSLKPENEPAAKVGAYNVGKFETIESADKVFLVIDVSQITYPPDCFLDTINYDHGRVVTVVGVKVIGAHNALHTTAKMRFKFTT